MMSGAQVIVLLTPELDYLYSRVVPDFGIAAEL